MYISYAFFILDILGIKVSFLVHLTSIYITAALQLYGSKPVGSTFHFILSFWSLMGEPEVKSNMPVRRRQCKVGDRNIPFVSSIRIRQ